MKILFRKIIRGLEKLEGIFDTYTSKSYSMRKVMAFYNAILIGIMDYVYIKNASPVFENLFYILSLHFLMILLLLGIITAEHIIKYKQQKEEKKESEDNREVL